MTHHPSDAGIPLLTEVIPGPAPADAARTAPAQAAIVPLEDSLALGEPRSAGVWDEAEWDRLEREIRERVLLQLLERIDVVLVQRVRDSLADALQTAVEGLATDIRAGLYNSVRDAVSGAVSQEIAKLKSTKK